MSDEERSERTNGGANEGSQTPFEDLLDRVEGGDAGESTTNGTAGSPDPTAESIPVFQEIEPTDDTSATFDDLLARIRSPAGSDDHDDDLVGLDDLDAWTEGDAGASVLLVGPLGADRDNAVCISGFATCPTASQRMLLVTLGRQGMRRFRDFRAEYGDQEPREVVHVARGDEEVPESGAVRNERLTNPGDLPQLGITVSRIVDDWEDEQDDITVCLHSLTMLLEHASEQRVFRFLHLLLDRLEVADARVHVHLDANAHDPETVHLFGNLFDASVRVTPDGLERID